MKVILRFSVIVLIIILGCNDPKIESFQFSNLDERLIINTKKERGSGILKLGISSLRFKNEISDFGYPVEIPEKIKNVKRAQLLTDFRAEDKYYIDIIKGEIEEKQIFIIDENNNNSLLDDSIRLVEPINWSTEDNLIKCYYSVSKNKEIVEEKTWLRIGRSSDGVFRCGKAEHQIAEFLIDNNRYKIGIANPYTGDFTFDFKPIAALFSENEITKDTLYKRDILTKGEFLKLDNQYYKLDTIARFGENVTLIKENNFDDLVGIQVGMKAPGFTCVSTSTDTINSSDLHDKIIILANSCACGGDTESTQAYFDIQNKYSNKVHILRLDSNIDTKLQGNHIEMDNEYNKDIYDKYRSEYCSRTCFVINKNNRIIDKFPVTDWYEYLPKLVN